MANSKTSSDTITVDLQPLLLPLAIVLSAILLSISMYLSAGRIGSVSVNSGSNSDTAAVVDPTNNGAAAVPTAVATPSLDATTSFDDDAIKGNRETATVGIVEFSDFECPFCGKFFDETLSQITTEYIDTGKAIFVYRDLPLSFHPLAQVQAEAAECAGEQGQYYAMHDRIFQSGGQNNADQLKTIASELGLNTGTFNTCLDNNEMADEVNADAADAAAAGISGTPGFVVGKIDGDSVDGEKVSGALPFASFQQVIEKYL
ncbi:thioredoxin domain-containing protein [Candidatus Dojkabacteria bacterium]|uniref:Thioredoxin domain-containing protein n=1 Tax=Candidatus Dojkabacteria bacterium TaxID=2099670 RepID=A0A955L977_9BACT|nr:thioredoxin domain-containing protein [Candidatus Dojkabacteria bacterium]